MNFDELTMLDPDDIPYDTLDDGMLKRLIIEHTDLFMATNSLAELSIRNSRLLTEITLTILEGSVGDKYLSAYAFTILYRINSDLALKQIPSLLNRAEKVLLSAIVEMIVMDLTEFDETPELWGIALKVVENINKYKLNEFQDESEIKLFLITFSEREVL